MGPDLDKKPATPPPASLDAPARVKVLLVDDHPENLLALEAVLKPLGQDLVAASSGAEALRRLLDEDFAVILLDVRMPDMDGFETAEMIRRRERSRSTPIIFMTAVSKGETFVDRGYSAGAVDYIFKPFAPEILRAKVAVFVELFHKTEQVKRQAARLRLIESREHRRELTRLRAQRNRFFTLALDKLCVMTLEGRMKELNEPWATRLGWTREELMSRSVDDFLHPDDRELSRDMFRRMCAAPGEPLSWETRFRVKDGSHRWLLWSAAAFPREKTVYAAARDITDRKEMEEGLEARVAERTAQLESANQELEAFAYSVSHDLRAPLRKMDGFAKLLLERVSGDEEAKRLAGIVCGNSARMGRLIDDLLAFSRLGRAELAVADVDMNALARDAWEEALRMEPGRQVRLRLGGLAPAAGDAAMLRQVFLNLFSNALKFTRKRDKAAIEVWSEPAGDGARSVYAVKDNGAGFDMKYASKLFGVFQRLHPAAEFEGTGIGLALVDRIVKRHGGRSWAEGAVDGGATIRFELPRGREEGA